LGKRESLRESLVKLDWRFARIASLYGDRTDVCNV
jgi:hypothetical protein